LPTLPACSYLLAVSYVSLRFARNLAYISLLIIKLCNLAAIAVYVADRWKPSGKYPCLFQEFIEHQIHLRWN